MKIIVAVILFLVIVLGIIYFFPLAVIDGNSMFPTFRNKGIVLTTRFFNRDKLKIGEVYVYAREDGVEEVLVVKRLTRLINIPGLECFFEGDNPTESYDSRHYGFINKENIIAKVICKIK